MRAEVIVLKTCLLQNSQGQGGGRAVFLHQLGWWRHSLSHPCDQKLTGPSQKPCLRERLAGVARAVTMLLEVV